MPQKLFTCIIFFPLEIKPTPSKYRNITNIIKRLIIKMKAIKNILIVKKSSRFDRLAGVNRIAD
jgi:hypothetical protein